MLPSHAIQFLSQIITMKPRSNELLLKGVATVQGQLFKSWLA